MGYKVIFAAQALEQLEQIIRFIAQDDPAAAERFGNYLVDRADCSPIFRNWEHPIESVQVCDESCANRTSFTIVSVERSR
jgi:hypothetical protein